MKVLLDQGLPRSTADVLRSRHVDCAHTGEIGLSTAADAEILARARKDHSVVVTLDADFHRLMAQSGARTPSVVRLRMQGAKGDELAELLLEVFARCKDALEEGALVSVRDGRIRIRKLPLRPSIV